LGVTYFTITSLINYNPRIPEPTYLTMITRPNTSQTRINGCSLVTKGVVERRNIQGGVNQQQKQQQQQLQQQQQQQQQPNNHEYIFHNAR